MFQSSESGTIIIQIDGLAEPILREVLNAGGLPTLSRWLTQGSHRLIGWESDLPSMTSSSQSGILYGNNANIPAFRWYEKDSGRLFVSNHPRDALLIERRQATDHGLLRDHGSSVGNILSGSAEHCVMTMSRLLDESGQITARTRDLYAYFLNPPNVLRAVGGIAREVMLELWQAQRQRLLGVRPRVNRGGTYPFVRAVTTVLLRDITTWMLVADMRAGRPISYADYLGYDEVAHHSGPTTSDALGELRKLDTHFARLELASLTARRPYHVVVLSDHGQSTGATFTQRYGLTLAHVIDKLIEGQSNVQMARGTGEGSGQARALSRDAARIGGIVGSVARRISTRGASTVEHVRVEQADVVVCASGNLALVYFANTPGRLSLETLERMHPHLLQGLRRHPGVGFLMLHSESAGGPVVLGRNGSRDLGTNLAVGEDPLALFNARTPEMLRRLSSYPNVGDIVVNSLFDTKTGHVAAFEELVGCHGGAGGPQTSPFMLYPAAWGEPAPIVGAEQLHKFLSQHIGLPTQTQLAR